jgi:hypothetical protein
MFHECFPSRCGAPSRRSQSPPGSPAAGPSAAGSPRPVRCSLQPFAVVAWVSCSRVSRVLSADRLTAARLSFPCRRLCLQLPPSFSPVCYSIPLVAVAAWISCRWVSQVSPPRGIPWTPERSSWRRGGGAYGAGGRAGGGGGRRRRG